MDVHLAVAWVLAEVAICVFSMMHLRNGVPRGLFVCVKIIKLSVSKRSRNILFHLRFHHFERDARCTGRIYRPHKMGYFIFEASR